MRWARVTICGSRMARRRSAIVRALRFDVILHDRCSDGLAVEASGRAGYARPEFFLCHREKAGAAQGRPGSFSYSAAMGSISPSVLRVS